jgi:hypothetical protein
MPDSSQPSEKPQPIVRPILVRKQEPKESPAKLESQDEAPAPNPPAIASNATPHPSTATLQPSAATSQPSAATPQPSAATPHPSAATPILVGTRRVNLVQAYSNEDDRGFQLFDIAIADAPPWLLSILAHLIILIGLGLRMLPDLVDPAVMLEVVYIDKLGDELDTGLLQLPSDRILEVVEPVLSEDDVPEEDPLAAPPDISPVENPTNQSSKIKALTIGMALSGREKGMKKALLAAYGGTDTTESAVIRGLEWLKRNQDRDGMWSLIGKYSQGAPTENRAAATAMALLAFQGHGSTHKSGPYQSVVARGWNGLIKKQDAEGNFFFTGGHHHRLYTHAQATIALCELYGMTKDETLKLPAEKALSYCFSSQSPQGGWRYSPGGTSDTSVTGWFVMALQSGRMAGLTVPGINLDRISAYLDTATTDDGTRYAYMPGQSDTLSMTAEGLLCRQYLGWKQTDPRLVQGLDYLVRNPISFADMDVYYWYYCTQAMHHMGGQHWNKWNSVLRQSIPEEQLKTGNERGSWEPSRDRHGHLGGRLYTTCLCVYMLEVYYRHLPIYKHQLN